jgi:hypothetical protein
MVGCWFILHIVKSSDHTTSVWLAQLVESLAAPMHVQCSPVHSGGPGSILRTDNLDSEFHPFGVGEISSSWLGDRYSKL